MSRARWCKTLQPEHVSEATLDLMEQLASEVDALVTRDPRTGIYRMGAPGSRTRLCAAHEATGFYASGSPRPRENGATQ